MYLERLLQINMATLAALGALLLGMGQRSEGPPLLVILAAAVSVWLTDVTGRFRLGRWMANVLMLVGGGRLAPRSVSRCEAKCRPSGFAWFLIYLQIILLFQAEGRAEVLAAGHDQPAASRRGDAVQPRHLVRSAAGDLHAAGLLGDDAADAVSAVATLRAGTTVAGGSVQLPGSDFATSVAGPAARAGRWPARTDDEFAWLAGRQQPSSRRAGGAAARASAAATPERMGCTPGPDAGAVLRRSAVRAGRLARPVTASPQPLVGFTDKVTLGELGQIIESREEVMRVQFLPTIRATRRRPVHGDIYLQGAI